MPVFYWACNLKLSTRTLFSPFYFRSPLPPLFSLTDTPYCPISFGTWKLSSLPPQVIGGPGEVYLCGMVCKSRVFLEVTLPELWAVQGCGEGGDRRISRTSSLALNPHFCGPLMFCMYMFAAPGGTLAFRFGNGRAFSVFLTLEIAIDSSNVFYESKLRACRHPNWNPNWLGATPDDPNLFPPLPPLSHLSPFAPQEQSLAPAPPTPPPENALPKMKPFLPARLQICHLSAPFTAGYCRARLFSRLCVFNPWFLFHPQNAMSLWHFTCQASSLLFLLLWSLSSVWRKTFWCKHTSVFSNLQATEGRGALALLLPVCFCSGECRPSVSLRS